MNKEFIINMKNEKSKRESAHLSTALCGNVSSILHVTLMFTRGMNSSTSIGSEFSVLSRWILTSGGARFSAPGGMRFALSEAVKHSSSAPF